MLFNRSNISIRLGEQVFLKYYFNCFNISLSNHELTIGSVFCDECDELFTKLIQTLLDLSGLGLFDGFTIHNSELTLGQLTRKKDLQSLDFFLIGNFERKVARLGTVDLSSFIATRGTFVALSCSSATFLSKRFFSATSSLFKIITVALFRTM